MNQWMKSTLLIGACSLLTFLTACSSNENASNSNEKIKLSLDDSKVYVGFSLDTLAEDRWYKDKEMFESTIEEMGGEVKTLAANGVDSVQIKQAELLIEEGVDVLVVVPHNADVSSEIVEMAHKANVKVISYDRLITNADVDYYISYDNKKAGMLQAEALLKEVNEGNFAYIGGAESDNNAVLLREGAMEVLQPYIDKGKIKIVYDKYTDEWKPKIAEENMKEAIKATGKKINAVIAANDGTAGGVIRALKENKISVPVTGQDAEVDAIKRIKTGTQTMTVYKPINDIAKQAAEMAMQVGNHKDIETKHTVNNGKIDVPSVLLDPITVTAKNIDKTVMKDGFITKEDLQ